MGEIIKSHMTEPQARLVETGREDAICAVQSGRITNLEERIGYRSREWSMHRDFYSYGVLEVLKESFPDVAGSILARGVR